MIWLLGSCIGITLLVLASTLILEIIAIRKGRKNKGGRIWLACVGVSIAVWWLIAWVMTYFEGWLMGMKTFVGSLVIIGFYGVLSVVILHYVATRVSKEPSQEA